ncbi:class I SAM-dependent methyltransferase [Nocardia sp. CDC159]|uniref:Class I SAM-dependent methyltransferase n=1 Tax=Nocardia pulmonis TaxID=2951408 RepID=A0A9X2EE42_9NOCA|nr:MULTISPECIES: class I SAM-dependent methyltransferase [Nocardia]MCM6778774.1 class I SAM-dependent methyltransferase [Nocardia pulmonis]MCM6791663.1 class I SAM-dependent methyltransferase [Nocardia sp. CDC159]
MGALDWDHNAFYRRTLRSRLPPRPARVLDVGCGAGAFAAELARTAERVDAIDRSPQMIAAARRIAPPNVICTLGDVLEMSLPQREYDAIVSVTALHHMPLERALPALAGALRPGGVLAAVALPRTDLPRELPIELAAAVGHRVLGAAFRGLRSRTDRPWYAKEFDRDMPLLLDPELTTRQVRGLARELLPGARVRRLVFWRYLLTWRKPL